DMDQVLRGFIRGHLLVCGLVGGLSALGLYLIGVPFALLLGIIAGILDIIPFFGPILGAVPALALALLQSWQATIYTLLLFVIIQQVEGNIITPKILGEAVGLHPLIIIFALLAGGHLWGVTGMIIALPLAAVIRVAARYMLIKLVSN
ncbi:MAG TPA: AI-2E family transporter, partial [Bacillota bacterium]|nr:AI-2E family transporter [Bacillota bacterium]